MIEKLECSARPIRLPVDRPPTEPSDDITRQSFGEGVVSDEPSHPFATRGIKYGALTALEARNHSNAVCHLFNGLVVTATQSHLGHRDFVTEDLRVRAQLVTVIKVGSFERPVPGPVDREATGAPLR